MDKVIKIVGKKPGPKSVIISGIHGTEKCGINAFKEILSTLEIESGEVVFLYGNPKAIELNRRFIDVNLNRMFKSLDLITEGEKQSYEYSRAQFLKQYLKDADVLLDIHASSSKNSKPFIICESNADKIVNYLSIDTVVSGFDKLEPGGTDYYMNSIGKIGICIECGFVEDEMSTRVAVECIIDFLRVRQHISGPINFSKKEYIKMDYIYITKTDNFKLNKEFDDFEIVNQGQVIGIDGSKEVSLDKDSIILFARNRSKKNEEAFLVGNKRSSLM